MADSMYVGMNAAAARAHDLEVIADNLANVDTPGFHGSQPVFQSYLAPHRNGELVDQVHVEAVDVGVDVRAGPAIPSDSPLDIRVGQGAWLAVELKEGGTGFTRDGRLSIDVDGTLRASGLPVLSDALTHLVVDPKATVVIDEIGQVVADGAVAGVLGRFELAGPIERVHPSVVQAGASTPVETHVETHMREDSNVNALGTVVRMMQAQRAYDEAMQAVTTSRHMDEKSAEIGRVRG